MRDWQFGVMLFAGFIVAPWAFFLFIRSIVEAHRVLCSGVCLP